MNFNVTDVTKALQKLEEKELEIRKLSGFTLDDIIQMLAKGFKLINPTADVVEVVRCKDCKCCEQCYPAKAKGDEAVVGWYCKIRNKHMQPDDFCSYGERRDT